jgi:hypothetical protein
VDFYTLIFQNELRCAPFINKYIQMVLNVSGPVVVGSVYQRINNPNSNYFLIGLLCIDSFSQRKIITGNEKSIAEYFKPFMGLIL